MRDGRLAVTVKVSANASRPNRNEWNRMEQPREGADPMHSIDWSSSLNS
jgi:hypothetical protein